MRHRPNPLRRCRWLLLCAFLALGAPAAWAQEPEAGAETAQPDPEPLPVQVSIDVGVENFVRASVPTPVRLFLTNTGPPVQNGRIVVATEGNTTARSFRLPRQAQQQYLLYVRLPEVDHHWGAVSQRELTVTLTDGRRRLAQETLPLRFLRANDTFVATVSDERAGLGFLTQGPQIDMDWDPDEPPPDRWDPGRQRDAVPGRMRAAHLLPADVPRNWAEFVPLDLLVVTGRAWAQIDTEQRRAIRQWTAQGGRLLLCGDLAVQFQDEEAQSLLPLLPASLLSRTTPGPLNVGGLVAEPVRPMRPREPLTIVTGEPRSGAELLLRHGGEPLAARGPYLRGSCTWLGFDPLHPAFRLWPDYEAFWRSLLPGLLERDAPRGGLASVADDPRGSQLASVLPPLKAPPIAALVIFALVYAGIFGPLNVLVLRRLRRTVRAWFFTPALALAITFVALAAGHSWGQGRMVVNSVTVLEGQSGARSVSAQSVLGIFSPTGRVVDLRIPDPAAEFVSGSVEATETNVGSALHERRWPPEQDGVEARFPRVRLLQYSLRVHEARWVTDLGGPVHVTLSSRAGQVRNDSDYTLARAYLEIAGDEGRVERHPLPELRPGATAEVTADGWQPVAGPAAAEAPLPEHEADLFRRRLGELYEGAVQGLVTAPARERPWLVAELERPLPGRLRLAEGPEPNTATLLLLRVP